MMGAAGFVFQCRLGAARSPSLRAVSFMSIKNGTISAIECAIDGRKTFDVYCSIGGCEKDIMDEMREAALVFLDQGFFVALVTSQTLTSLRVKSL